MYTEAPNCNVVYSLELLLLILSVIVYTTKAMRSIDYSEKGGACYDRVYHSDTFCGFTNPLLEVYHNRPERTI